MMNNYSTQWKILPFAELNNPSLLKNRKCTNALWKGMAWKSIYRFEHIKFMDVWRLVHLFHCESRVNPTLPAIPPNFVLEKVTTAALLEAPLSGVSIHIVFECLQHVVSQVLRPSSKIKIFYHNVHLGLITLKKEKQVWLNLLLKKPLCFSKSLWSLFRYVIVQEWLMLNDILKSS